MGFFCCGKDGIGAGDDGKTPPPRWSEIGVGAGDLDLAQEVKAAQGELVKAEPPVAQSVYVCGWCFRVVERSELNHLDKVSAR